MKRQIIGLLGLITSLSFTMLIVGLSASIQVAAQANATPTFSPYSTLINSEIRGIDQKTIDAYRKGEGAGLALPAELNGYPGPRHVLDMADALGVTSDQRVQLQALYDTMNPKAIALGNQILEKEATMEKAFRDGTLDDASLSSDLTEIGAIQTQLRYVHLSAHLATVKILSSVQIAQYNQMRGYSSAGASMSDNMNMATAPATP